MVVDKSGEHRFSLKGQGSGYTCIPWGICIDLFGNILVSDLGSNTVHLLDQDGQFLTVLHTPHQGIQTPLSMYVDDENNLHM